MTNSEVLSVDTAGAGVELMGTWGVDVFIPNISVNQSKSSFEIVSRPGCDGCCKVRFGSQIADVDTQTSIHSHSIVPGGLLVTSYTTRLIPFTSLIIRVAHRAKNA